MTIQDIVCFLKLAETLNYTKTAEELFISQPAVTRHINSLEDELGVKLFDRSVKRSISLTESGMLYLKGLKKCKGIYEDTINAIRLKSTETPLIINMLRGINMPDEFVEATGKFMESHPTFHHFTNFIDASDFDSSIENGQIIICQKEYAKKAGNIKTFQLTNNPISYYLIANKKHHGFSNTESPDFDAIKNTTLFLPKNLPEALKEQYFIHLKKMLGSMPVEVMYLDSMDSVELFLRSGRCFTIANGWSSLLDSKHHVSYEMDFASDYIAMFNPSKCTSLFVKEYLDTLKGLSL